MSTVLVTGGSGFIGSHCLEPLAAAGFDVHAVQSSGPSREGPRVTWHTTNLLVESEVELLVEAVQPTHLLHLAWFATPGVFPTAAINAHWAEASLMLVRRFAECGGRRVVSAGTSYEYDWQYGF